MHKIFNFLDFWVSERLLKTFFGINVIILNIVEAVDLFQKHLSLNIVLMYHLLTFYINIFRKNLILINKRNASLPFYCIRLIW